MVPMATHLTTWLTTTKIPFFALKDNPCFSFLIPGNRDIFFLFLRGLSLGPIHNRGSMLLRQLAGKFDLPWMQFSHTVQQPGTM